MLLQPDQILSVAAGHRPAGQFAGLVAAHRGRRGPGERPRPSAGPGQGRLGRALRPGLDRGGAGLRGRFDQQRRTCSRRGCLSPRSPPTSDGWSTSSPSASPSGRRRSSRRSQRGRRPTTPWSVTRPRRRSAPSACGPPRPPSYAEAQELRYRRIMALLTLLVDETTAAVLAEPARRGDLSTTDEGEHPRGRQEIGPAPARRRAARRTGTAGTWGG